MASQRPPVRSVYKMGGQTRYPFQRQLPEAPDPFEQISEILSWMCSEQYAKNTLVRAYQLTEKEAVKRTKRISPHMMFALAYLEQARASDIEVSFLPAYYAILNLIKVVVLCGPLHARLNQRLHHGATYPVHRKNSRSLRTEEIDVWPEGVIPLFYETLVGKPWGKKRTVQIGQMFRYARPVSEQWQAATGEASLVRPLAAYHVVTARGMRPRYVLLPLAGTRIPPKVELPALAKCRRAGKMANSYDGPRVETDGTKAGEEMRSSLVTRLLYTPEGWNTMIPVFRGGPQLVEDIPLLLLFFYFGSVVRYKPEFAIGLEKSSYWPVVLATRSDALYRLLLLLASHIDQVTILPPASWALPN